MSGSDTYWALLPEVEREFRVTEWAVAGMPVWPIVRIRLGHWLFRSYLQRSQPSWTDSQTPSWQRLVAQVRRAADGVEWSPGSSGIGRSLAPGQRAVLWSDGVSLVEGPTGLTDRCLEPLRVALLERGLSAVLVVPGAERPTLVQPSLSVRPHLKAGQALMMRRRDARIELPDYAGVRELLHSREASGGLMRPGRIRATALLLMRWAADLQAVAELAPLAFVSEYYSFHSMAFVLACRMAGVPTVDVQHGLAGRSHFAYGSWENVPEAGYPMLPDWFWCWSSDDASSIQEWAGSGPPRTLVGGVPWLDDEDIQGSAVSLQRSACSSSLQPGHPVRVLYTLCPDESPHRSRLMELIRRSPATWEWRLRCHPTSGDVGGWSKAAAPVRGLRLIDVVDPSREPLQASLLRSDVHVTQYSSVVIEASILGVPSVAVHPLAAELFPNEVAAGRCAVVGPDDLEGAVTRAELRGVDGVGSAVPGSRAWALEQLLEMQS
jgi:hypothetical protein